MSKRHSLAARTAAAVTTLGAALAGALVFTAAPANAALHETNYSFESAAYGTLVVAQAGQLRSDRTAWETLGCTRLAGISGQVSQASLDSSQTGNPMVDVSAVRSTKRTFTNRKHNVRAGVIATNAIGHVALGIPNQTPVLTIDGLKSVARSWVDNSGVYHAKTGLSLAGVNADMGITGIDSSQLNGAAKQLVDAIQSQVLDNVISVLAQQNGNGIVIPGLGEVYLPGGSHYFHREITNQKNGYASAQVKALKIVLYGADMQPGGGDDSIIYIGSAWSRIRTNPAGILAGRGYGLSAQMVQGLVGVGRVAFQPLPCNGTQGNTYTAQTTGVDLGKANFLTTDNVLGKALGNTFSDGSAKAWTQGSVANINLSAGGHTLNISALTAQANVYQKPNGKLRPAPQALQDRFGVKYGNIRGTKIGGITLDGQDLGSFYPGDTYTLTDSSNNPLVKIVFGEVTPVKRGLQVIAAHVYVLDSALQKDQGVVEVELGVARTRIAKY